MTGVLFCGFKAHSWSFFDSLSGNWKLVRGKATYKVRHIVHPAFGSSTELEGQANCQKKKCSFSMRIPARSFISAEAKRDKHLREAVETDKFPYIQVKGAIHLLDDGFFQVDMSINFHGQKSFKEKLKFKGEKINDDWRIQGSFELSLNEFKVPAPKLFGVPIKDKVKVSIDQLWGRVNQ